MGAARKWEHTLDHTKLPKQLHWYRTHEMAFEIFRRFHRAPQQVCNSCCYFAHTNSAKCTTNASNGREGPAKLFRNCQEYLPGEIKALKPQIIITQGKMAGMALQALGAEGPARGRRKQKASGLSSGFRTIKVGGSKILWIHSSHPRNYGPFNQERRDRWSRWALAAYRFAQKS